MVRVPGLIPGFEILERLGSGGVSSVFRARRLEDGQEVALKVTSLGDLDPEFRPVERFQREAELLSRLNHPALPRLHGFGVTEEHLGWMALELVRGEPLSSFAQRPVAELLPIFIRLSECLLAIAQEGIVHRDVSPDNVLVEERAGRPFPRLIDLGVAKDLLAGGAAGNLTRHGAFLGKLAYASPEQLVGLPKGQTLDFRSDVYSLGLVFHEVLTGEPPIKGESVPDLLDAHLKGRIPPLVVPEEQGGPATRLVELVARMTARRREERPGSWEEVLAELWRAREEVSPISATLARLRGTVTAAAPARPPEETLVRPERPPISAPASGPSWISRVTLGHLVLAVGAVAFAGALAFSVFVVRAQLARQRALLGSAPAPTPTAVAPPAAASAPGPTPAAATLPARAPSAASGAARTPRRPAPTRTARPTPAPAREGTLELSLLPSGELEEVVDEKGRVVSGRRPLPARLRLPAGRYRVRMGAPSLLCERTFTVTVVAGETVARRESCVEVK